MGNKIKTTLPEMIEELSKPSKGKITQLLVSLLQNPEFFILEKMYAKEKELIKDLKKSREKISKNYYKEVQKRLALGIAPSEGWFIMSDIADSSSNTLSSGEMRNYLDSLKENIINGQSVIEIITLTNTTGNDPKFAFRLSPHKDVALGLMEYFRKSDEDFEFIASHYAQRVSEHIHTVIMPVIRDIYPDADIEHMYIFTVTPKLHWFSTSIYYSISNAVYLFYNNKEKYELLKRDEVLYAARYCKEYIIDPYSTSGDMVTDQQQAQHRKYMQRIELQKMIVFGFKYRREIYKRKYRIYTNDQMGPQIEQEIREMDKDIYFHESRIVNFELEYLEKMRNGELTTRPTAQNKFEKEDATKNDNNYKHKRTSKLSSRSATKKATSMASKKTRRAR